MYVYLVWYLWEEEDETLLKIVGTEEKAKAEVENFKKLTGCESYYTVEEVE